MTMNIIKQGGKFQIFGDAIQTFDTLPASTYRVEFHKMMGFYLTEINDLEVAEEKIYGDQPAKISKVLSSYAKFQRSMGIILSGDKGMGKSLFVRLLSQEVIAQGMPVVIVTKAYPGIADFLDEIEQECLVLFDEFEKMFSKDGNSGAEKQDSLLSLFDGMSSTKRLYAITVNEIYRLSEFMINRTGRFHYHFRFEYPTAEEVREYMKDKVEPAYHDQIDSIVVFTQRVKLNYDSLRSIAFELNQGYSFSDAIADLNVMRTERLRYNLQIKIAGQALKTYNNYSIDLFNTSETINEYLKTVDDCHEYIDIQFNPTKAKEVNGELVIEPEHINVTPDPSNEKLKDPDELPEVEYIKISHVPAKSYKYTV